ncbi:MULTISPECIES: hypothetical protein [Klebsiella]|nr:MULTISPECIES: hypothetical protein [Klebsiella]MCD5828616.1 hypothetical protein [Klebsiella pneumoniae]MCJ6049047.1 hypothetical protein [Klebsiella pneumoniae]MCU6534744.1 hypothetical protein [Klebsiella pneumoniae]MCU6614536.1 hypothetical protein [Klebsiella pneumoniae]MDE4847870.1 hypothetical protein [Klebsiella pneumoniae]
MAIRDMETMLLNIRNKKIAPLMEESMRCYNAFAYRASISTAFNAMFHDLCDKLEALKETNSSIKALYQEIEKKKQQQEVYESYLIDNLASNNLISKLEKDILDGMRVMRNKASHPTDHEPTAEEARYVFTTIIDLVLSKGRILSRSAADDILSSLKDNNYFPSKVDFKENTKIVSYDIDSIHESAMVYLVNKVIDNIVSEPDEENYVLFMISLLNQKRDDLSKVVISQINKTKYTKDEFKWLVIAIAIQHADALENKFSARIISLLSMDMDNNNYSMSSIRSVRRAFVSIAEKNPDLYGKLKVDFKNSVFSKYDSWDSCISSDSEPLKIDFINYFTRWLSPKFNINGEQYKKIQKRVSYLTANDKVFASKLDDLTVIKIIFSFLQTTTSSITPDVEGNPSDSFIDKIAETIPKTYEKLSSFRSRNPDAYNTEAKRMKVDAYLTRLP